MRRFVLLACAAALLALTACDAPATDNARTTPSHIVTSTPAPMDQSAEAGPAERADDDEADVQEADELDEISGNADSYSEALSFDGKTLVSQNFTIVITEYKVIQPGEPGNQMGEAPVIAFWYDLTAHEGSSGVRPLSAWELTFTAHQMKELDYGHMPDLEHYEVSISEVEAGQTVSCSTAYELLDDTTKVRFVVWKDAYAETILSEYEYDIVGK